MSVARRPRARDAVQGGSSEANSAAGRGQGAGGGGDHPHAVPPGLGHRPPRSPPPPPLAWVTLSARQPDPAQQQRVASGRDKRQRHLSAVWDLAMEAQGVKAFLRIIIPYPLVIKGCSNLPDAQELVGMFAYHLVSGHWWVQTGVAGIGEEGTVTTAGIIGPAVVKGMEKQRPEWVDVAWLAMRIHVGRVWSRGGVDVIDVKVAGDAPPARKREAPAPPTARGHRCAPPPLRPRVHSPPQSGRHVTGRGGLWTNGWSSKSNIARRGRSARSARRPRRAPPASLPR